MCSARERIRRLLQNEIRALALRCSQEEFAPPERSPSAKPRRPTRKRRCIPDAQRDGGEGGDGWAQDDRSSCSSFKN